MSCESGTPSKILEYNLQPARQCYKIISARSPTKGFPWRCYLCLRSLLSQEQLSDVPGIEQRQKREVGYENARRRPLPAVELPVGEGPQHRSRKKGIRMQRHVG